MKDRLYNAIGHSVAQQYGIAKPESPLKSPLAKSNSGQHNSPLSPLQNRTFFGSPKNVPHTSSTMPPTSFSHPVNPSLLNTNQQHPLPQPQNPMQPLVYGQGSQMVYSAQPTSQSFVNPSTMPPLLPSVPTPHVLPASNVNPTNFYTPLQQPQQTYQPNVNDNYPEPRKVSYQDTKPATAWNDPPIVQPKIKVNIESIGFRIWSQKKSKVRSFFFKPPSLPKEPAVDVYKLYQPTMPSYSQPTYYQSNQVSQVQPMTNRIPTPSNMYDPPLPSQPPANGFHSANNFNTNQVNGTQILPPAASTQQRNITTPVPERAPKSPIPTENAIIQAVLDELLKKCIDFAHSAVFKRKLEDVAKKLESLYDKLRDKTVSISA